MHTLRSFADAMALDDAALHALLDGAGDSPERLWAAWAIALRGDPGVARTLERAAAHEPSAGVRAHLALMLVAHGERAAAMALAEADPAAIVRAAACRHLARSAPTNDEATYRLLLRILTGDGSPEPRAAVLDGLRADAPIALRDGALGELGHRDRLVREAVMDFIQRNELPLVAALDALRAHAFSEKDAPLRERMLRLWIAAEGIGAVVRAASLLDVPSIVCFLTWLAQERLPIQENELRTLIDRADSDIDEHVVALQAAGVVALALRDHLTFIARFLRARAVDRDTGDFYAAAISATTFVAPLLFAAAIDTSTEEERALIVAIEGVVARDVAAQALRIGVELGALERYYAGEPDHQNIESLLDIEQWDVLLAPIFAAHLLPLLRRFIAASRIR